MTIKLDKSPVLVVATCSECPWWSAAAFTTGEAWASAARHEARSHPGVDQARKSDRMTRQRTTSI